MKSDQVHPFIKLYAFHAILKRYPGQALFLVLACDTEGNPLYLITLIAAKCRVQFDLYCCHFLSVTMRLGDYFFSGI